MFFVDFADPLTALIPGATGRVLEALTRTSLPISGRAIAEVAGVSPAQTARVLAKLVSLGLVQTRPAPPATLYVLASAHIATSHLTALSELGEAFVEQLNRHVAELDPRPVSVVVYGSFARGEARSDSDIDLLVVRPDAIEEEDPRWRASVNGLWNYARQLSGNPVEVIEVGRQTAHDLLRTTRPLWRNIRRDARVIHGEPLDTI